MTPARPSSLRVFEKSLHCLSAGWLVSVGWLWLAQLEQSLRRDSALPDNYAVLTLIEGAAPAIAIELSARFLGRWLVAAPGIADPRREWHHAFWWTLVPNIMLLGTTYLMVLEGS